MQSVQSDIGAGGTMLPYAASKSLSIIMYWNALLRCSFTHIAHAFIARRIIACNAGCAKNHDVLEQVQFDANKTIDKIANFKRVQSRLQRYA